MDIATISLILQLLIFAMLIYGYYRFRLGDVKGHGLVLFAATIVHIGVIVLRMVPQFFIDPEFMTITTDPLNWIHWGHVALGLLPPVLGGYITLRWASHGFDYKFCRGKWLMRVTVITWIVSLLFGIVMYFSP